MKAGQLKRVLETYNDEDEIFLIYKDKFYHAAQLTSLFPCYADKNIIKEMEELQNSFKDVNKRCLFLELYEF